MIKTTIFMRLCFLVQSSNMAGNGNKLLSVLILSMVFQRSQLSVLKQEDLHKIWNLSEVPNENENFYQFWRRAVLPKIKANPSLYSRNNELSHDIEPTGTDFPCKPLHDTTKTTSVHRLKPNDINVVAALGDSVTAGFGAKSSNLLTLYREFRGVSWSIGGDKTLDQVTTLPNILKKYNSRIKGFSLKETIPLIPCPKDARFNVAVTGAVSSDIPHQVQTLVRKLKLDSKVDFENDWKVVTLWIGANDLFNYCKNDKYIPEKYIGGIREALDILHKEVPKVFVNLVQAADVTKLSPINQNSKYCRVVHSICCDCALTKGDTVKMKVSEAAQKYQKLIVELVSSGR